MDFRVVVKDNHTLTYKLSYCEDYLSVKINVNHDNEVVVKAHKNMNIDYIDSVVIKHFDKLYRYINDHKDRFVYNVKENYLLLFNQKYDLQIQITTKRQKYEIYNNKIYLFIRDEDSKLTMIKKIYHDIGHEYLINRANKIAKKNGFECIFETKWYISRWGQCIAKTKVISFATTLVAFEEKVIDYIIYHELCHLIEPNHSRQFWALVANYYPEYKWAQRKLKFQC